MENSEVRCPSCGSKDLDEVLRPYCSVVCRYLGIRGLGWRINPYRIVDMDTNVVLAGGPQFDLSANGTSELVIKAKAVRRGHKRLSEVQEGAKSEQAKRSIVGSFSIPGVENIGVGGLP